MVHSTYVLYSALLGRYYVGSTSLQLRERLRKHLTNHKGYTGKASDWEVVYQTEFCSVKEARLHERLIKKRGAKRFLNKYKSEGRDG